MNCEKNSQSNIIKFPGTNNPKVDEQQKEFAKLIGDLSNKMSRYDWHVHILSKKELLILSNHGEAIELSPLIAARLNSSLATSLINNSFMEDLLWEKKEKAIAA